jgi:hypothetical protein
MQTRTPILAVFVAIGLSNHLSVARAADVFPEFDITANCKTDLPDSAGTGETLRKCSDDEQHAKQQLAREWSNFAAADKAQCIKETNIDGTPSYVELRVCLKMASDTRGLRRNGVTTGSQPHPNED